MIYSASIVSNFCAHAIKVPISVQHTCTWRLLGDISKEFVLHGCFGCSEVILCAKKFENHYLLDVCVENSGVYFLEEVLASLYFLTFVVRMTKALETFHWNVEW